MPYHTTSAKPSRRDFFSRVGDGLHGAALATLLGNDLFDANPLVASTPERESYDQKPRVPHFEPKAKSVIHLFMNGGPSQVDLFDHKPLLEKHAGSPPPRDIVAQIEFTDEIGGMMPSPYKFSHRGKCGMEISDLLPHLGEVVDDITLIRSMYGEHFNHEPSLYLVHSGRTLPGRPALGSWVVYGLGSENQDMPGYVVLDDPIAYPINGIQNWQAGWLPPVYQGTRFRSEGPPVLNLEREEKVPSALVEAERRMLRRLSESHRKERPFQPQLAARIASYEMAAKMQLSATDALDTSQESEATRQMYGMDDERTRSYGLRLLRARRLVERGVRFVQVFIEHQIWDNHLNLDRELGYACAKTDKPVGGVDQRPQATWAAGFNAGDLGRRIRTHAALASRRGRHCGPRPRASRVQPVDGRRRRQSRSRPRRDRRHRPQSRRGPRQRARLPRNDAASNWARFQQAHLRRGRPR